jgi:hypothetical protein
MIEVKFDYAIGWNGMEKTKTTNQIFNLKFNHSYISLFLRRHILRLSCPSEVPFEAI